MLTRIKPLILICSLCFVVSACESVQNNSQNNSSSDLSSSIEETAKETPAQLTRFNSIQQILESFVSTSLESKIELYQDKVEEARRIPSEVNAATKQSFTDANVNDIDEVLLFKSKLEGFNREDAQVVDENTRFVQVLNLGIFYYRLTTQDGTQVYLSALRNDDNYTFYIPSTGSGGLIDVNLEDQTIQVLVQMVDGIEIANFEKLLLRPSTEGWQ